MIRRQNSFNSPFGIKRDSAVRNNSEYETIRRNYIQKYRFVISEYERVRAKQHREYLVH